MSNVVELSLLVACERFARFLFRRATPGRGDGEILAKARLVQSALPAIFLPRSKLTVSRYHVPLEVPREWQSAWVRTRSQHLFSKAGAISSSPRVGNALLVFASTLALELWAHEPCIACSVVESGYGRVGRVFVSGRCRQCARQTHRRSGKQRRRQALGAATNARMNTSTVTHLDNTRACR